MSTTLALLTIEGMATAASMAYSVMYFSYYTGKKVYDWNKKTPEQMQLEQLQRLHERIELLETQLRLKNTTDLDSDFVMID